MPSRAETGPAETPICLAGPPRRRPAPDRGCAPRRSWDLSWHRASPPGFAAPYKHDHRQRGRAEQAGDKDRDAAEDGGIQLANEVETNREHGPWQGAATVIVSAQAIG